MKKFSRISLCVLAPLLVGSLGSFFTSSSVDTWYTTIIKPEFNPPNWVFGPVWTLLYILMGVAIYLTWEKNFGKQKNTVVGIFAAQLWFNFLWPVFFFGIKSPLLALIDIVILLILILFNIQIFYRVSKWAGYLLIPYLLWVSFASVLNASIFLLN